MKNVCCRLCLAFGLITSCTVIFATTAVEAQTTNLWAHGLSGKWELATNWTINLPPTNNSLTFITNASPKTVTIDATTALSNAVSGCMTISNLTLSGPSGSNNVLSLTDAGTNVPLRIRNVFTLTAGGALEISNGAVQVDNVLGATTYPLQDDGHIVLNSASALLVSTNSTLAIGYSASGTLTISNGTVLAFSENVGQNAGSSGTLTLAGGTNQVGGNLIIGNDSSGTVWVTGGHLAMPANSIRVGTSADGQMTVSNGTVAGNNLTVGHIAGGLGTLTIAGGTNQFKGSLTVGNNFSATGTVWMTGGQLALTNTFTTGTLTVGGSGPGRMTVSNGTVIVHFLNVAIDGAARGTLSFTGGLLVMTNSGAGTLSVGSGGIGEMTIAGGTGLVKTVSIGSYGGTAIGTLWITRGLLSVTNGNLLVGEIGSGSLTMSNGFVVATNLTVGAGSGRGTFTMAGGTNSLSGNLTVGGIFGGTGAVWVTGGRLVATNATTLISIQNPGQMTISNGIVLAGSLRLGTNATANGTLTVAGGIDAVSGPLTVGGLGTGTVWVTGGQLVVTNTPDAVGAGSGFIVDGSVTITNGSSIVVSNVNTVVGNAGSGSLTVFGGSMSVTNLIVGNLAGSRGTITFAGGTNTLSDLLSIGKNPNATGAVWLTGGQLVATNNSTFISYEGAGQMTVSNGTWLAREVYVGTAPGSQGTLTVAGGTWDGPLALQVGSSSNSIGTVWVTGGTVMLTNISFFNNVIGNLGTGRMIVSNGLVFASQLNIKSGGSGGGTLTMAGGTNTVYSPMILGNFVCTATGVVEVAGGTLFVTNSANNAVLEVRSGTVNLSAGTLTIDKLVITNSCGHFVKTGGTLIQNSPAILGVGLDADGDGLPNDWEQANGLDPLDGTGINGASGDLDGDGLTNLQEFQLGSSPVADIKAIKKEGIDIRVTWQAGASKTNALQRSPGSNGSYSNNFADIFIVTNNTGAVTNYLNVGAATNFPSRYYRVRLVP